MERGSLSNQRDEIDNKTHPDMELLRSAVPRRVFTLSQIPHVLDRLTCPQQPMAKSKADFMDSLRLKG
jgi:tryptophanase